MKSKSNIKQKGSGRWLRRFVRRMEIGMRWQYRRKVFFSAVCGAIWEDVKMAMLGLLAGIAAPFVLVLTIPCRLGIWLLYPIITPLVKTDPKLWLEMAAIIKNVIRLTLPISDLPNEKEGHD